MYNLPRDLALKKKKQALRRLSQSSTQAAAKPLISPIHAGRRLPGLARGTTHGVKLNTGAKVKNPFQLDADCDPKPHESVNPFSSVPPVSKPPPYSAQSGSLFKSSGSEFSNNPFITSLRSSFSTPSTSSVSAETRSYAQVLNSGERSVDPRLEYKTSTFTSNKPDSNAGIQPEQNGSSQNPFAKAASSFKFPKPKPSMGAQSKVEAGASRLHTPASSSLQQSVVTLSVRNIDQNMCKPEILHNHFQQFGDVSDLKCMPRKGMATVSYSDHKAALRAKQQGTFLDQSHPPMHIVLQKKRATSSLQPGEGEKKLPRDYVWVHPSMQLASLEDGGRGATRNSAGLQTEKSPLKGSIFSRLGDPVKGARKDKQDSSLNVQPEVKQKFSPRRRNEDEEYIPNSADWAQEEHDIGEEKFEQDQNMTNIRSAPVVEDVADDTMDTVARHVGHSYDLRSIHRGTGGGDIDSNSGVARVSLVGSSSSAVPDIPKPLLRVSAGSSLTAAQAYEALEERDTQIRKTMVKQTSLATAQAIVGTCPDMCPEKERYRRESIKRLSIFEMLSSSDPQNPQVDHTKAVKEYSGSAADKDEPLPHELRPTHVLAMTMDYLVTMVINNRSAEGSGEWFNFIWNRTRAIRKDITLQHLCSPAMVHIVEKCARFHILCGHLMCEEDVSAFDAKMNSDNLSKCLQTLKEFYRDLRRKGIECRGEAEFCCYDILLHLNEGDVLCKIDDYTPGIYRYPLVAFAIQVALTWSSNNFVRFFRLVRSATYLNSCLLHRYFNQVRSEALGLLMRTHTAIKQSSFIPVTYVQEKLLCMDSQEQAVEFCGHHGIRIEEKANGNQFVLSKDTYLLPDKPCNIIKSRELVEQKNNSTFGEVVQGGPLPPMPNHIPISSINNNASQRLPTTITASISYDEKDVLVIVEDVISEVTQFEITSVSTDAISEAQQVYSACEQVGVELIDDIIVTSCKEISEITVAEEKERVRKIKEEKEKFLSNIAWNYVDGLIEHTTLNEIIIIVKDSLEEEHLLAEIHSNAIDHVMLQMAGMVVAMEIQAVVEESIKEAIVQRKESLNFIASNVIRIRMAKYFAYWRRATLRCRQVKKCLETFPPSAPLHPLSWLLEQLQPSEKRPRLELPTSPLSLLQNRTSTLTTIIDKYEKTEEERKLFWAPISIPDLVHGQLMARLQSPPLLDPANSWAHHHWQLLLVLPADSHAVNSSAVHWLKCVLSSAPPPLPTCMGAVELLSLSNNQKIKIVVKSFQGFVPSGEQERNAMSLKGTSAILMYFVGIIQVNKLVERLSTFIINIKPQPQLPLLVLCDDVMSLTITETAMIEDTLCASFPVLSAVKFVPYSLSSHFAQPQQLNLDHKEGLCEAVRWLAITSSLPPVLTWQPLYDHMEQGLLELFVQPLMADHKLRLKLGVTQQPCRGVVAFYNAAVEHLALLATSEGSTQFSWPCQETSSSHFSFKGAPPIYWNESSHLVNLNKLIMDLKILTTSVHKEEISLENYLSFVRSVCEAHQVLEPLPLITSVHRMLQQTDNHVSWAHVITMCMSHLLKSIGSDWWVCRSYKEKQPAFKEPPEWSTCMASTTLARVQQHTTPTTDQHRGKSHRRHHTDPFSGSITVSSNYCSPSVKNAESMKKKFLSTLEQEWLLNKEFDDLLLQYNTSTQP